MSFFNFFRVMNRRARRSLSGRVKQQSRMSSVSSSSQDISFTSSTSSSKYRYDGGRRYHGDEKVTYLLPNDYEEDDRINGQHFLVALAFGSHFDSPVQAELETGTNVLDSACGPATWAMQMAKTYPNSKVYGTDISERFPESIKPNNCEFLVHNIVENPPFPNDYFGFIHQRFLLLGIAKKDWPQILAHHMRTLKPGGWIELTELSYAKLVNAGPKAQLTFDTAITVMNKGGMDIDLANSLEPMLKDAGFVNVQTRSFDMPMNHGGKIGELFWEDFQQGYHSARPIWAKIHPDIAAPGNFEKYIEETGEECKRYQTCVPFTRAYAQKPPFA
ncbi:S-adenosyl-L-methionine-dependent methyltransferase [Lichtheimia hyalospora FSU 10163]|nr:S-adenosyl-L-methionine-dependent methyltransferase [Lichtheimia hyalospora FSU 10163]